MTSDLDACEACLRRGELVGRLSPQVARLLDRRGPRPAGLLGLPDEELIAALGGRRTDALSRWLAGFRPERARRAVAAAGLGCVCRHSPRYPPGLLQLTDPPAALYVAGSSVLLEATGREPAVTVVGGRAATPYALEMAEALGRGLAAAGVCVVSGLALGVDGAAHRGALAAGERSGAPAGPLAVLGSGADVAYPVRHRPLYARVRTSGAVVSELPPGTAPARWAFPARNRIMAALGRMTVVVEAGDGSGSLITAGFAGDLGRDVGAVPGRVTTTVAAGSNRLLHEGARVIRGAEDVLDVVYGVEPGRRDRAAGGVGPARAGESRRPASNPGPELDPSLRRVLEGVEAGRRADAIGRAAGIDAGTVRAALGRLELLGLVVRDGLGAYERRAER